MPFRKHLLAPVVLGSALAACSSPNAPPGARTEIPPAAEKDAGADVETPPAAPARRLETAFIALDGEGGAHARVRDAAPYLYDSVRGEYCRALPLADGTQRCVPPGPVLEFDPIAAPLYSDAACKRPAVSVAGYGELEPVGRGFPRVASLGPSYGIVVDAKFDSVRRVVKLGALTPTFSRYRSVDGKCTPDGGGQVWSVGSMKEVPLEEFAPIERKETKVDAASGRGTNGARIGVLEWRYTSTAFEHGALSTFFDETLHTACTPTKLGAGYRCVPRPRMRMYGYYTKPTCAPDSEAVAAVEPAPLTPWRLIVERPPFPTLESERMPVFVEGRDSHGAPQMPVVRHLVERPAGELFLMGGGGCSSASPSSDLSFVDMERSDLVPESTFAEMTLASRAAKDAVDGSRLKIKEAVWRSADGAEYRGGLAFEDTLEGAPCDLDAAADDVARCLPRADEAWAGGVGTAYFADDKCAEPIWVFEKMPGETASVHSKYARACDNTKGCPNVHIFSFPTERIEPTAFFYKIGAGPCTPTTTVPSLREVYRFDPATGIAPARFPRTELTISHAP